MTPSESSLSACWLAWEADKASGYSVVGRDLRFNLERHGMAVHNSYMHGWDCMVGVCTPTAWMIGPTPVKRNDLVIHTMFEGNPIPPGWVGNMNNAGLIWTPSHWCETLFRECGVTTDIFVSGYGINQDTWKYHNRHGRDGTMRFVIWADTIPSRKNVVLAAKAFIAAGLPNAELEIKLHSYMGMTKPFVRMFVDAHGEPLMNVGLHAGAWPLPRMVSWVQQADCAIYLSGGEGFGLMPLQMASTGLPVICAANTGMLEYLSHDGFLLVDCPKTEKSKSYSTGFNYHCEIFQPDFDQAVELIRWAYYNREAAYSIGDRGAVIAEKYSWIDQTRPIYEELVRRYGRTTGEV